jgi:hypothetical protein
MRLFHVEQSWHLRQAVKSVVAIHPADHVQYIDYKQVIPIPSPSRVPWPSYSVKRFRPPPIHTADRPPQSAADRRSNPTVAMLSSYILSSYIVSLRRDLRAVVIRSPPRRAYLSRKPAIFVSSYKRRVTFRLPGRGDLAFRGARKERDSFRGSPLSMLLS